MTTAYRLHSHLLVHALESTQDEEVAIRPLIPCVHLLRPQSATLYIHLHPNLTSIPALPFAPQYTDPNLSSLALLSKKLSPPYLQIISGSQRTLPHSQSLPSLRVIPQQPTRLVWFRTLPRLIVFHPPTREQKYRYRTQLKRHREPRGLTERAIV